VVHGVEVQGNKEDLEYTCESGHETVVKYLVDHGADIFGSKCSLEWVLRYYIKQL